MESLTLIEWGVLAQLILTVVALIGIITSMYMSMKALREVQADRRQRQSPHLLFEYGGYEYPIEFKRIGKRLPGINPTAAEKLFADFPEDAESVGIMQMEDKDGFIKGDLILLGCLTNYGLGSAMSTKVTWVPYEIRIGSEGFTLNQDKLQEPRYHRNLNTVPAHPNHIMPNGQAGLTRLPTFIVKDFEKKISRVDGVLEIKCFDVFGQQHLVKQEFHLFTEYNEKEPRIHITFSDVLSD